MSDEPKVYQSGFAQVAHLSLEEERAAWRSRLDAANAHIAELEEVMADKRQLVWELDSALCGKRAEEMPVMVDVLYTAQALAAGAGSVSQRIAALERERDEARADRDDSDHWRKHWAARAEAAEAEVAGLRQALANVLCSGCLEQDAYEQVRDFMEGTRDAFYDPVLEREARLREALEWFADRDNYDLGASETYTVHGFVDRARRALQQQPQAQEGGDGE